jgi:hypothetical protein
MYPPLTVRLQAPTPSWTRIHVTHPGQHCVDHVRIPNGVKLLCLSVVRNFDEIAALVALKAAVKRLVDVA